jgi:hypothetical protein
MSPNFLAKIRPPKPLLSPPKSRVEILFKHLKLRSFSRGPPIKQMEDSMSKTVKRLLVAALISASGFASTILWYKLSEKADTSVSNAKQIARLVSTVNDVQKKPVQKIIWQSATDNEILHVGEAIRTAANSEARIEFLGSNTAIDLEPDSAIVLEETDGKLSLDFLKGNILVKADSAGGGSGDSPQITLKSGDKQIALGKSEITLGKTNTGNLDVQVLKGNVAGLDGMNADKIKILSPLPGEPVYVNPAANEWALVKWQPLPAGYEVFLEAGTSRSDLKPVAGALAPGEKGELTANLKIGKAFYRLVARSANPQQPEIFSTVLRASVIAKIPPVPLYPEKETSISLNKQDPSIQLLWSNPAGFSKLIVEIATSADLKQNLKVERIENSTQLKFVVEKSAAHYWRVSGVLEGRKEVVSSPVQKFTVNVLNELLPPALELPKAGERFPAEATKEKGLNLSWRPSTGAEKYKVIVERIISQASERTPASIEKVFEEEGRLLQVSVKNLKPGNYTWTVASIGKTESSKPSEKRSFTLQSLPVLKWADGKTQEDYYYLTLKPSVSLKWERGDTKATNWVARAYSADGTKEPVMQKFTTTGGEMAIPADGRYEAEVEALDDRGVIVARSVRREIKVSPAPLLPAPQFATSVPSEIEANGSGMARVEWTSVEGANRYTVYIKSPDGKVAKEVSFNDVQASLRDLMPGEYKLSIGSVDQHGRVGPEGEPRALKVPKESNVKAPKLKGLKVK